MGAFAWADAEALPPALAARVAAEFPAWTVEQGLCARCLETYQAGGQRKLFSGFGVG